MLTKIDLDLLPHNHKQLSELKKRIFLFQVAISKTDPIFENRNNTLMTQSQIFKTYVMSISGAAAVV